VAVEHHLVTTTLLTGSTGICQYRFVAVNASGQAVYPTSTGALNAVAVTVSTASSKTTEDARAVTVALQGSVVKVQSAASTLSVGDIVSATTDGRALVAGTTNYRALGTVIAGSSGAARFVTVALTMVGST
jgi:hypothetical protein